MTDCPSEGTWLLHVDGELPAAAIQSLLAHLGECPRCSRLVAALGEESRLLARALEEAVLQEPAAGPMLPFGGLALAAGLVVAAAGLWQLIGWLSALGRESPVAPVDGNALAVGLLFDAVFYLFRQGASMLDSIVSALGVLALVVLGGFFAISLRRRSLVGALLAALGLVSAGPAAAFEVRHAKGKHDQVLVRAEETVDDSVVASGDTVVIEGTITGDLIAAGRRIVVRGIVKGDLLTVSQRVEVEGSVEGNLFSAAETVVLRGPVVRNAYAFAQELHVERSGRVEGDLTGFAAEVAVDGRVGRDLMAFAGATRLRGEVARKADVRTGGLHVEGSGRIGGDLLAHVEHADDVRLDPGAQIAGRTETRVLPPRKSRYLRPGFYIWRAIWLVAAFVSGLLLRRLHPDLFPLRLPDGRSLPRALGTGFVTLVALPAAAILAAVTLVGLPLGLFGLALWLAALYVAPLLVAAPVGRLLLQRPGGPPASFAPPFLLGLLVLTLITNVPYVGCLVRLAVVVLGLGIGVTRLRPGTPLVEA